MPFPGHGKGGIGRAWPLLTGERAHYELAAGRRDQAERLLHTLEGFANEGGMLPEQVWDADDIPERALFRGQATGSAMPLAWAHAEYASCFAPCVTAVSSTCLLRPCSAIPNVPGPSLKRHEKMAARGRWKMISLTVLREQSEHERFERQRAENNAAAWPDAAAAVLAKELRRHVNGEVRFDAGSRALYATDGSNYRQVPIGVVIPRRDR